jgi:hypothetical protein
MLASPDLRLQYSLFACYIAEVCKFEVCKDAAFILTRKIARMLHWGNIVKSVLTTK